MYPICREPDFTILYMAKVALILFGSGLLSGRSFDGFNNAVITGTAAEVA